MLIIDCGIEIHKAVYGNEAMFAIDELGNVPNYDIYALYLLASILAKVRIFGCSKQNPVVLAVDARNNWRKAYFEGVKEQYFTNYGKKINLDDYGYKISRKKNSKFDWKKIYTIANDVLNALDKSSDFIVIHSEGAEADDVVGVCAKEETSRGNHVFVSSSDKDFKQLLIDNDKVHLWHPFKKSFIEDDNPNLFMQILYLTGDAGDDVPQVKPRMGPATARKTLPNLQNLLKVDKDFRFRYETNVKLICFDHIPNDIQKNILDELNKNHYQYSQIEMINLFTKYKIDTLFYRVDEFMLPDFIPPTKITKRFLKNEKTVNEKVIESFLDELF